VVQRVGSSGIAPRCARPTNQDITMRFLHESDECEDHFPIPVILTNKTAKVSALYDAPLSKEVAQRTTNVISLSKIDVDRARYQFRCYHV
jgi:hypothetical protein